MKLGKNLWKIDWSLNFSKHIQKGKGTGQSKVTSESNSLIQETVTSVPQAMLSAYNMRSHEQFIATISNPKKTNS